MSQQRMWRTHELKSRYDVVIVGAGVHGLATAYYLGKLHGIRSVALIEQSYRAAARAGRGNELQQHSDVTGIRVEGGRGRGVTTRGGGIEAGSVVNVTAGWATTVSQRAGVPLQIVPHPLQACVTEPLKPFLDKVIVSATLHVYVNQTDKDELVIVAEIDPYQTYYMKAMLPTLEQMSTY